MTRLEASRSKTTQLALTQVRVNVCEVFSILIDDTTLCRVELSNKKPKNFEQDQSFFLSISACTLSNTHTRTLSLFSLSLRPPTPPQSKRCLSTTIVLHEI
jgi:hypothetical protein